MKYTITKAELIDLRAIKKYSSLLHEKEAPEKHINDCITNNCVWVAKYEDGVIGYVLVELFDNKQKYFPGSMFVSELYVDSDYRSQGIGAALVEIALKAEYPKEYNYFSLTHDPDEEWLTRYYERFGFKQTGVTDAGNIMLVKK